MISCRVALAFSIVLAVACGEAEENYPGEDALVEEPDGRLSYYSGSRVAELLQRGVDLEDVHNMNGFLRVRVPASLLQAAGASPRQRKIISLEQPYPGVEILLHQADDSSFMGNRATRMKNTRYLPGQPWLSGHAILRIMDDGTSYAGVHLITHSGTLPGSGADISWGMTGCTGEPDCPPLSFSSTNPCDWPPLPTGWNLVHQMGPQTGQPVNLDLLCQRR